MEHHGPDLCSRGTGGNLPDYTSGDDDYPVRQLHDFVEVGGVEEHGRSGSCGGAEPVMHISCGSYIEAACRILGNDDGRSSKQLPGDDELLLVTTAQRTRACA